MKIAKICPQGYCNGVKNAYNTVIDALTNPSTKKPITLLGNLIHNEFVMNELKNKGAIIINDNSLTRLEMLDHIDNGSVIFSAHGVTKNVYNKAKAKGLDIIDTTCPYVSIIHKKIEEYSTNGYEIIYIGTKKHPECEGVLGLSNHIYLVTNRDDISKLNINSDKIYVTNQTTLSLFDINDMYNFIKEKYPKAIIDNKICNATTLRQEAVINQDPVDLCIVVGDKNSSNTNKLAQTSSLAGINTILIESVKDLYNYSFDNINSVSITSGASVPSYLVDEIIEYLNSK